MHLMNLSLQVSLLCCSMGSLCMSYLHLRLSLYSSCQLGMHCLLLCHHGGPQMRTQQVRRKCHCSDSPANKTGKVQSIPNYKCTSVTLKTSEMAPQFFFPSTAELYLSKLIGKMRHPDMQKIQTIRFLFENMLHWQYEVGVGGIYNGCFSLHIYF